MKIDNSKQEGPEPKSPANVDHNDTGLDQTSGTEHNPGDNVSAKAPSNRGEQPHTRPVGNDPAAPADKGASATPALRGFFIFAALLVAVLFLGTLLVRFI